MSLSANIVRTLFTIIAVGISYDFEPQISAWLRSFQPNVSSVTLGFEAAAIIVIPTLLFATFIIRQIGKSRQN